MMSRILEFLFFLLLGLFVLNEALEASELKWEPDVTLSDYRQAGHLTGYKVFFKITEDCSYEENYNYSVDVGDQTSLEVFNNDYFIPGRQYKFQIKSYAVIRNAVYESELSAVAGCYVPRPLTGVEQLNLQQQNEGLKKKSLTREN